MLNKTSFFLLPILLLTTISYSQSYTVQRWGLWGNYGLGVSLAAVHKLDLNIKVGLSAQFYSFVTGYRYLRGTECLNLFKSPSEHINEHAFLLGYSIFQNRVISLIVMAGPSIIHGDQRDSVISHSSKSLNSTYSIKNYYTQGGAFELQFIYKINAFIGFGTSLNVNYNRVNSYIGISGNVYMGRLCK